MAINNMTNHFELFWYLHCGAVDQTWELRVHVAPRDEDLDLALGAAGGVLVLHAPVPGTRHLEDINQCNHSI